VDIEGPAMEVAKIKKYIKKDSFIENFYPCPKALENPKTEFKDDIEEEKYLTDLKEKY
jgi:hypothetical protein